MRVTHPYRKREMASCWGSGNPGSKTTSRAVDAGSAQTRNGTVDLRETTGLVLDGQTQAAIALLHAADDRAKENASAEPPCRQCREAVVALRDPEDAVLTRPSALRELLDQWQQRQIFRIRQKEAAECPHACAERRRRVSCVQPGRN